MNSPSTSPAYTPGPWTIQAGNNIYGKRTNSNGKIVDVMVAWVNTVWPTWEAETRLIAAAPELLAALKGLSDATYMDAEFEHMIDAHEPENCVLCIARQAIAKAEGRS